MDNATVRQVRPASVQSKVLLVLLAIRHVTFGVGHELRELAVAPAVNEVDGEARHTLVEELESLRLLRRQLVALAAHVVVLLKLDHTLVQLDGEEELAERLVHGRRLAFDGPRLHQHVLGRDEPGAGKVQLLKRGDLLLKLGDLAVGEDEADVAAQHLGELLETRQVRLLARLAEGQRHDLILAKHKARVLERNAQALERVGAHVLAGEHIDGLVLVAELLHLVDQLRLARPAARLGLGEWHHAAAL
mmetsp:Transcript_23789/g.67522  ORF Transcript_23789/g.67522 Transcript_23789/m.67522 type:complete len:247 (-) Transcript_23789:87-827(-)